MYDYQNVKLMHLHGSQWAELHPREHHDSAEHDPERIWGRGARIFKCDVCDEQVAVIPPEGAREPEERR